MSRKDILLAFAVLMLSACNQTKQSTERIETYSLCPEGAASRERLIVLVQNFAFRNQAEFTDRSAESQNELSAMRGSKGALPLTGGPLIVLAVEKPNDFRVSLSNLGLREKVSLGVRYWNGRSENARVSQLLSDIDRSWVIQTVEGGVLNDPPCTRFN